MRKSTPSTEAMRSDDKFQAERGRKPTTVTDTKFNPTNNLTIHKIKTAANFMAEVIGDLPPGLRKSIALQHLETASMWAVKAAAVGDS